MNLGADEGHDPSDEVGTVQVPARAEVGPVPDSDDEDDGEVKSCPGCPFFRRILVQTSCGHGNGNGHQTRITDNNNLSILVSNNNSKLPFCGLQ